MTQEEKVLLLKDLCARFPYGVNVDIKYSKLNGSSLRLKVCSEGMLPLNTDLLGLFQEEEICLKPYLRPMSSMTEEEKNHFKKNIGGDNAEWYLFNNNCIAREKSYYTIQCTFSLMYKITDWLNKKGFDYRGLIPMGLALEAPENMYIIK